MMNEKEGTWNSNEGTTPGQSQEHAGGQAENQYARMNGQAGVPDERTNEFSGRENGSYGHLGASVGQGYVPDHQLNEMAGQDAFPVFQPVPETRKQKQPHGKKPDFWKRGLAVALAVVLVTGSASGISLFGGMKKELNTQMALINSLSSQIASQNTAIARANSAAGLTNDEAGKAAALGNANSAAGTATNTGLSLPGLGQGASISAIAKAVGPSVVGIRMTLAGNGQGFQGNQATSEGSGIIIKDDGYIMTNYHVVSYADPKSGNAATTTLEVFLPDGRTAKAKFVGGDSENDLAVVKIDLTDLPVANLGNSSDLQAGDLAIAIGNPLGMEFAGSVTVGVVSALNRKMDGEGSINLIQTDAAINPGNSGGALVNANGQVIGINSAKISQTGVEGLGFAIAIDDAKPIVSSLIQYGYVKNRPFLGIGGQDVTDTIASTYNLSTGIYVTSVDPAGGAAKAGIQKGDVITGFNGKDVATMAELVAAKKAFKPGDVVTINLVRGTEKMTVKVTLTEAK